MTIRDCDVIHAGGLREKPWMGADWSLFSSVIPEGEGICEHRDYFFDDIRLEPPFALIGVNCPQATLRKFRFRNIRIADEAGTSLLRADAEGLSFENVSIAGRTATNTRDLNLTLEGKTKDITVINVR